MNLADLCPQSTYQFQALDKIHIPIRLAIVKLPPFILASASPRRAELLGHMDVKFQVLPSDAMEIYDAQLSPHELCQLNAHRKARTIAKKHPDALVLGADTLVFLERQIFGKPQDMDDARRMLSQLQGRTHQVVTGVSLIHLRGHQEKIFAAGTDVTFQPLTADQIKDYLTRINPLDKAGAYAIQEHGEKIIAEISGSYSNVVGLPVEKLREALAQW
jgi:septum formation protein